MRIIQATPYSLSPTNSGGAVRTLAVAQALADAGHEVTLLSPGDKPDTRKITHQSYRSRGRLSHFVNWHFMRTLKQLLLEKPDLLIADFPYQAWMLSAIATRSRVSVVYNSHNVEGDRFRRTGSRLVPWLVRKAENRLCHTAHAVLAVSEDDRRTFRDFYSCESVLLPNGVDAARFTPAEPDPKLLDRYGLNNRKVVLYFGSYDYSPNVEAVRFLIDSWPSVLRREPEARLIIVGRQPPPWAQRKQGVVVTGAVEDIIGHLRLAHVVAVPLTSGGGTRLKILESLACGQTVLSTPFGASGIAGSGPAVRLTSLEDFIPHLLDLLKELPVRGANTSARELAQQHDWRTLVRNVPWEHLAQRSSNTLVHQQAAT